jgi:predicted dienelactone hydrolase
MGVCDRRSCLVASGLVAFFALTGTACGSSSHGVGIRQTIYVDHNRPTPAHAGIAAAPSRTLEVWIYYPVDHGKPARRGAPFPLILFSHGSGASPSIYAPLLSSLARAGFVVVAPVYPLTNTHTQGGVDVSDVTEQPRDASFVLDQVLAQAARPGWLHGFIDPHRIGAAGHSLGAMTTYGLAYNKCCRDPRIRAAAILSGATVVLPGQTQTFPDNQFFTANTTPLLVVEGDHDTLVPPSSVLASYQRAPRPKFYMTMIGGTHYSDEEGGTNPGQRALTRVVVDFFNTYLRHDSVAAANLLQDGNQRGVARMTAQP